MKGENNMGKSMLNGECYGSDNANDIVYDNTTSGLTATNTKLAIDELATSVSELNSNLEQVFQLGTNKKAQVVSSLAGLNLGLTNESTWDEICTTMSNKFPTSLYLIKDGVPNNDVFGTFSNYIARGDNAPSGSVTYNYNNKSVYLYAGSPNTSVGFKTGTLVDLTYYTKVHVDFLIESVRNSAAKAAIDIMNVSSSVVKSGSNSTKSTRTTFTTDISNIVGYHYIRPYAYYHEKAYIYNVWFEV